MNNFFNIGTKASLLVFSSALLFNCTPDANSPGTEFAPQMYDEHGYEPLKQVDRNTVNPYGMNMRMPAANTVPRGKLGYYDHVAKDNPELAGTTLRNPLKASTETLADGEVLYARFCTPCHGSEGLGDGLVGAKFMGVANLTQDRLKAAPEGYIYHVITHGRGRMLPHGSQLNPEERWKISMFVKSVLQGHGEAPADDAGTTDPQDASGDENTNPATGADKPNPTNQ
jgi:mono/diheme cytochrome c family protein